jgi:hypothetical protein
MKTEYVTSSFHGVKFALRYYIKINMKSPISLIYKYTSTVHLGNYLLEVCNLDVILIVKLICMMSFY